MKVLVHSHIPFAFTHGGQQLQILRTREALEALKVEVDFFSWHDEHQTGELLHFFGRPPLNLVRMAQAKGLKVVVADLLGAQGARPAWRRQLQKYANQALEAVLPSELTANFNWQSYRLADACIALTSWEARLLTELFETPAARVRVIPNGVEELFLQSPPSARGPWLVCTSTIAPHKRVLELAQAAVAARTPLWVIGRPYNLQEPYARDFLALTKAEPALLRYEGAIEDRPALAGIYRQARGFVLLSAFESLSLSALEAAACECPLLLRDLPWARAAFGSQAAYCPVTNSLSQTAQSLRQFYDAAPKQPLPPKPLTWTEVARQLKELYTELLQPSA